MMKNRRPKEEKIIKDIRNLFRLKKEQNDTGINDIRNPFTIKKTKLKELKIYYLELLRIFPGIKQKNKTIVNQ